MGKKPVMPDDLQFYVQVTLNVYRDCAALCCLSPSAIEMDCKTIEDRTRKEGMSFLTKTLPSLGKCLDKALSRDIPFPDEHSFAISRKAPYYPKFLGSFWKLIFPTNENQDEPNTHWEQVTASHSTQADAVRAVRQICYLSYKLEGAHSAESEEECLRNFVVTDAILPEADSVIRLSEQTERALGNASLLLHYVLSGDRETGLPALDLTNIVPKHGPGSVATGEKMREKYSFRRFYEQLDREYSYPDYFYVNYSHLVDQLDELENMETHVSGTAKVVLVPKDSRGPRIISMEPLEYQWIQQGQMRSLVNYLERHPITAGRVNFTSQEVNRNLALYHSTPSGTYATMDMKDASDRVSVWLVKKLLPAFYVDKLLASRSDSTRMPDGTVIRLNKFAPMGSATCFPVEALIFWALAVGTIHDMRCARDLKSVPSVYVYGDDIIAPLVEFDKICSVYHELALKVNEAKCCVGRFFRESCGMDAYNQVCVTPLRHHKRFVMKSPVALLAYVAYQNAHRARGHAQTASFIRGQIVHGFGQLPVANTKGKIALCFEDTGLTNEQVFEFNSRLFRYRFNKDLQRTEMRIQVPFTPSIRQGEPDWQEIQRKGRMGSFQDPFGFDALAFEPCNYSLAKQTKLRWAWVDVSQLAGQ